MGMGTRRHHRLTLFAGSDRELVFFRLIQKCEPSSLEKGHYSELNEKKVFYLSCDKNEQFLQFYRDPKICISKSFKQF